MGGKSWFTVVLKSFQIIVEEVNGGLRGSILERSCGSSRWIGFRKVSLSQFLEGVEACCNKLGGKEFCKVWEEGGLSGWKAVQKEMESFIQCSVKSIEAKGSDLP